MNVCSVSLQAYLVYKYREREHPQTTINRGSKYTAAPKCSSTFTSINTIRENSLIEKVCDDMDFGNTLEKDIQVGSDGRLRLELMAGSRSSHFSRSSISRVRRL